jgi:hypothetical protein
MAATSNTKSPVNPRTGRVSKAESLVVETPPVIEITPGALSSSNAASYTGRSQKTLSNLRAQGKGPRFFRAGNLHSRVYYLVRDLDAWLEEQAAQSNSAA